ncbi:mitochondrial small ribosomal subunit Rsm22-domain-containing protein [Nemania sp. FL0916]|nr:mitochondrial small ribosomal subunit Rsm22-domain-containing protein [Nemania sp. FL0916]
MSGTVNISSSGEWQRILASSTIVIADFYADWCGPCKMIAPVFESLSTKYAKPGKIAFCKVNVDNHQSIAQAHGVSAMPTFLVFKSGSVIETIRGANPPALTAAVEKAVKLAGTSAPGASFAIPGRTLGGSTSGGNGAPARGGRGTYALGPRPWASFGSFNILNSLLTFFGLYFVSLFSFDPYKAAERSSFNLNNPRAPPAPINLSKNRPAGGAGAPGRPAGGVRTLADLGGKQRLLHNAMLSAIRTQRPCPQCRRRALGLVKTALAFAHAQPESSALTTLTRCRASTRPTAARATRAARTPLHSAYLSTTPSKCETPQPARPPDSDGRDQPPTPTATATATATPTGDDIELVVRQARHAFGNTLPKGYLTDAEYKLYTRLYGPPLRETQPEDVGMPVPPPDASGEEQELELDQDQDDVYEPSNEILLQEAGDDGQFQEAGSGYQTDGIPDSAETSPPTEHSDADAASVSASASASAPAPALTLTSTGISPEALPSEAGLTYINAVAKNQREFEALLKLQKDFETASLRAVEEEELQEEEEEDEEDEIEEEEDDEDEGEPGAIFGMTDSADSAGSVDRVHQFSRIGQWGTYPSTLQLPKTEFVAPITQLLDRTDITHVREAAEKAFGGPRLPFSVATPRSKRNAEQKPIPMAATHHRMSEIDADAFIATMLPAMYSCTMSVLVEIRKRLGSDWVAKLLSRSDGSGPRVLDVGTGGAGLAAWEQDRRKQGFTPPGKKTAVVGSEKLRQRVSRFLHNTTFLPRLPDYLHSGSSPDKLEGSEASLPRKQFDIIIASHQMMPIKEGYQRKALLDNLWELLSPQGGILIVLEKGHPRGFEAVADVRARLLDEFILSPTSEPRPEPIEPETRREREPGMIIAPCTNHKACPMYLTPGLAPGRKDFCHFSQRFIRPPFLQKVLGATHRNHEDVNFSFVAVQRGTALGAEKGSYPIQGREATDMAFHGYESSPAAPDTLSLPRNILPPIKRRGHVTLDLCTPAGTLERWTVPRSFSRQAHRDARKAEWGDLWALGAKTRVTRPVRLGKGGVAPNDGGVRAQRAAQAGKARVITLNADASGIYGASEARKRAPAPRRTKGGKKVKHTSLLEELESE